MREGRVWLGLLGAFGLVFVWALSSDDVPSSAPPPRVAAGSASVPQLQMLPPRGTPPARPAPAASAALPVAEPPVCDPAAADSKPSEADDAKVLQDLDAALAARSSERAEAVRHYIVGAVNALARMAVRTLDPAVYALAYQACRKREPACQMISARQWARIDPHNAVPWLHVAAEATAERNDAGVAEAMFQVARSTRSEAYESVLVREVLAALPKDLTPLAHGSLAARLLRMEAAWGSPGMQTARGHCSIVNTRDANRRQLCGDVAETLFRRSNTFVEQTVGIGIGRNSGWAAEKVEAAQAERDALMQVLRQQILPHKDMNACERGVLAIRALSLLGERGEAGSAREALRRSGKSVAEWAAAYRAAREREREKAVSDRAAAASAVMPPAGG